MTALAAGGSNSAGPWLALLAILVIGSRGYAMIEHRIGRYYEFVHTPQQPGRHA